MQLETVQFNDHLAYLDNGLLDAPGIGSTYLVRGDELAIVETGTSRCAPNVLDGLRRLGVKPADVRHILLTHVHMDHAGGTGTLIKAMPEATVHIHSRTAKYLIDPTDLLISAERALADLFKHHGPVEPVPADRIAHADELRLDLGRGVVIEAIYSPGHSPDHLAYYDTLSRSLFTGDSLGILVPMANYLGPVTPPPAISLDAQRATFDALAALEIDTLLFSHYGASTLAPRSAIEQLRERYEQLVALVHTMWQAGDVDMAEVVRVMVDQAGRNPQAEWAIKGWVEMSVRGLVVFFDRQAKKAREAQTNQAASS